MPYRTTDTTDHAPYRLKWWRRRKAQLLMKISMFTAIAGLLLAVAMTAGCRNDAITYAKMLDPRVKCTAVNTEAFMARDDADTAVCTLKLTSGRLEVWSCSSNAGTGRYPKCSMEAIYDAERR